MKFSRLLSKMSLQMLPAVAASVLSAAVIGALQLTPGISAQSQRGNSASGDPIVYVDVMPHINRDPVAPAVTPAPPPVVAETPTAPAKAPQVAAVPPAAERPAHVAASARAETPAPKVEPTAPKSDLASTRLDPVAVTAPKPTPATASLNPTPPASIEAPMQLGPPSAEPAHVFGMRVPQPVSDAGGAVVDVAKLPIDFAGTMVARPVWHVGSRIVSGVAGWIIPSRDR